MNRDRFEQLYRLVEDCVLARADHRRRRGIFRNLREKNRAQRTKWSIRCYYF